MPKGQYGTRLGALRRAEFGSPVETAVRALGILATSLTLFIASGDAIFAVWCAAYFLVEGLFLLIAGWPPHRNIRTHFVLAILFYNLSALNFAWLPLYMIWTGEPGYALVGGLGIFGMLLYTLHRSEYELTIAVSDCFHAVSVAAILLLIVEPRIDSVAMQIAAFICAVAVAKYFCLGMWVKLRQQHLHRQTERRYAEIQKERALGRFAGGIAHDFNNQLTAILGNLELLEELKDPSERRAVLKAVHQAGGHAAQTVHQLMTTTGQARIQPRKIALDQFLHHRADFIRDLMGDAIRVDVGPTSPDHEIWADPDMLETCLVELCRNARDAMPDQSGRIRIAAQAQEGGGPCGVDLSVEDDGPGADDDTIDLLTEPFYTTKRLGEGPGLGLSSVEGFARQSGGNLRITRSDLGGLRVSMHLPCHAPQLPASGAS